MSLGMVQLGLVKIDHGTIDRNGCGPRDQKILYLLV